MLNVSQAASFNEGIISCQLKGMTKKRANRLKSTKNPIENTKKKDVEKQTCSIAKERASCVSRSLEGAGVF